MTKRLLQINVVCNSGSTGKIAEGIGNLAMDRGWESYVAWGRWANPSKSHSFRIDRDLDIKTHGLITRLFDGEGLGSVCATKKLLRRMEEINPSVVQIHNLHGYYVNYPLLFQYLSEKKIPTFLTLHDCWIFTGHCVHFASIGCEKWKTGCGHCPNLKSYPKSWIMDHSARNWELKKRYLSGCDNLTLIPVCDWMHGLLEESFLKDKKIVTLLNGVNLELFHPTQVNEKLLNRHGIDLHKHILLAVSNFWDKTKGLEDIFMLRQLLPKEYQMVVVGHHDGIDFPEGILGINHTENQNELRDLYSAADMLINPTHADTFPTTNLEALACGTPVVTYDTGGCGECVGASSDYGVLVKSNTPAEMAEAVITMVNTSKTTFNEACRKKAEMDFDEIKQFRKYIDLYENALM